MLQHPDCPDCGSTASLDEATRRKFLKTVGAGAAVTALGSLPRIGRAEPAAAVSSESLVKKLYDSLTPAQKEELCFEWDYKDDRGLLRTHVSNNWNITEVKYNVGGNFFTNDQRDMIEALFFGLYNPDFHARLKKQLQDDAGGYGKQQTIAIFGTPGTDKFEFVMTGRHLTIRCDGNSSEHVAFGGPIFYGHAAQGFNELPDHPGNVYWHQALMANGLYKILDGKQRDQALIEAAPHESRVEFKGKTANIPGLPVAEMSADQKTHVQDLLKALFEPYRIADRDEALKAIETQGGLDKCHLSFYKSGDVGNDQVWDIWRLEGPAFVWHYRGAPHVHVWVNISDDPSVELNARG